MCSVLHMRDDRIYAAAIMGLATYDAVLREIGTLETLRVIPGALFAFLFPIFYATDPLRSRIARSALINFSFIIPEVVGSAIYALVSHGAIHPQEINAQTIASVLLVYALIIPLDALTLEVGIRFCKRNEQDGEGSFSLPILMLLSASLLLFYLVYNRIFTMNSLSSTASLLITLFALSNVVISFLMHSMATSDARAQRAAAERAASMRQIKHLRSQVETTTRRSVFVRRLRHDLANQVEVVHELAAEGCSTDADRYLETLQEQARELAAGSAVNHTSL